MVSQVGKHVALLLLATSLAPSAHAQTFFDNLFGGAQSGARGGYSSSEVDSNAGVCVYALQDKRYREVEQIERSHGAVNEISDEQKLKPFDVLNTLASTTQQIGYMASVEAADCSCGRDFLKGPARGLIAKLLQLENATPINYSSAYPFWRVSSYTPEFVAKWKKRNGLAIDFPDSTEISSVIAQLSEVSSKSCGPHFRIVWKHRLKELVQNISDYKASVAMLKSDSKDAIARTPDFKKNMSALPVDQLCKTSLKFAGVGSLNDLLLMSGTEGLYVQDGKAIYQHHRINKKKPYLAIHGWDNGKPIVAGTEFGCVFSEVNEFRREDNLEENEVDTVEPQRVIELNFYGMPIYQMKIVYPISYFRHFQDLQAIEATLNANGFTQNTLLPDPTRFYPDFMTNDSRGE